MKLSIVLMVCIIVMDMTALGVNMNNDIIYTSHEDATKTNNIDELDDKRIEGLKQKIHDIVEEAFYNITATTTTSPHAVDSLLRKHFNEDNETQMGEEDL